MKQTIHTSITNMPNELDFETTKTGKDLDVRGTELDDDLENGGSEA